MNIQKYKQIGNVCALGTLCAWSLLGFKRGVNSYDASHKKDHQYQYQYLYLHKGLWGIGSALAYINPFTFFIVLYKEAYRLEVELRGLEEEKLTKHYNEVL
jgi:hypothetical protein